MLALGGCKWKYKKRFALLRALNGTGEKNTNSAGSVLPRRCFISLCWDLDVLPSNSDKAYPAALHNKKKGERIALG